MTGGALLALARSAEYARRAPGCYALFGAELASALSFARGRVAWGGVAPLFPFGRPGRTAHFDGVVAAFQRSVRPPFGVYVGGLLVLLVESGRVILFAEEARVADVWAAPACAPPPEPR